MLKIDPRRLKALREARKLSIPEVAKRSGVSDRTLRRAEQMPTSMQEPNAEAVAKVLECRASDFEDVEAPDRIAGLTDLERASQRERERGDDDLRELGVRRWNASAQHEVTHGWELFEGQRFIVMRSLVDTYRRTTALEARVLGSDRGFALRAVLFTRTKDRVVLQPTVHVVHLGHARCVIDATRDKALVDALVEVTVPKVEGGRIVAADCGEGAELPADGTAWQGFEKLAPKKMEMWALRVLSVQRSEEGGT